MEPPNLNWPRTSDRINGSLSGKNVDKQLGVDFTIPVLISCMILVILIILTLMIIIVVKKIDAYKYQNVPYCWIHYPLIKSNFGNSNQVQIQPVIKNETKKPLSSESQQIKFNAPISAPSPSKDIIRVKAKGLLGRRGSNTSLTINLHCGNDKQTTAKECTVDDYLRSAGNRLSREQLKKWVKIPKVLHNEFWDVPMNYPTKLDVPGCGTKNRYKTILPNPESRVVLSKDDDDVLAKYINANYIKGHDGESKAYVATQGPLLHTVNDFWEMVMEVNAPAIVMITKLEEKNKVKCETYLPDHSEVYGEVSVTLVEIQEREGYSVRWLDLQRGTQRIQVQHFWFTSWPDHKTPSDPRSLLTMALEVEALRQKSASQCKGSVVVHCSAGIGRTGCFIAVSLGICQLIELNCVDILGIVCQLRLDRGGMVQTAEQYEFIHNALLMFEQSLPPKST